MSPARADGPFMSRTKAARHLGNTRRAFDRLRQDPAFPSAYALRPSVLVWSWPEIAAWLVARPRAQVSASHAAKAALRRPRRAA